MQITYDDLTVKCEKENNEPGLASVKSTTKPMAFGNIVFGGVIGAAIDVGSGAGYDYPTLISVLMGETSTVPAPSTVAPEAANSAGNASTNTPMAQK